MEVIVGLGNIRVASGGGGGGGTVQLVILNIGRTVDFAREIRNGASRIFEFNAGYANPTLRIGKEYWFGR